MFDILRNMKKVLEVQKSSLESLVGAESLPQSVSRVVRFLAVDLPLSQAHGPISGFQLKQAASPSVHRVTDALPGISLSE